MVDAAAAPIDRYVVQEYLSEGGMGAIYVGKKLGAGGFEKEVVLKQLLPEFTKQEEFIELFLREAKLSATLDHANIVHTIDLVNAGNEYFIVMEYLPGGDLRTLLRKAKRRGNRFSPSAAIYIAREVLSALSYAHVKRDHDGTPLQLIHRDVSPSNVLLSQNGEVKLTDFGIAKAATHTSQFYKVKGKIGYMSPEQARSQELDHRSDLYSLAVCFYEVLTGERLFIHAGLTTSADEIYSQPVPSVSRKVPGLPAELDKIVWKSLMIDPKDRYQTAGEFQEALMRCAHRNGLLISAPELAAQLREACGPVESWRDEEDEEADAAPRPATEIYDAAEDEEDEDFSAAQPIRRDKSVKLTVPELLQGIELTSIINNIVELMDESRSGREVLHDDSRPFSAQFPAPRAGKGPAPLAAPREPATSNLRGKGESAPQRPTPNEPAPLPGGSAGAPVVPYHQDYPVGAPPGRPGSSPSAQALHAAHAAQAARTSGLAGPNGASAPGGNMTAGGMGAMSPAMLDPAHQQMAQGPGGPPRGQARLPTPPPVGASAPLPPSYPAYPTAAPEPMAPSRMEPSSSMQMASEDARRIKPWMVIAAILIAGAVIAAIVGLSGPDIPAGLGAPAPTAPAAK